MYSTGIGGEGDVATDRGNCKACNSTGDPRFPFGLQVWSYENQAGFVANSDSQIGAVGGGQQPQSLVSEGFAESLTGG